MVINNTTINTNEMNKAIVPFAVSLDSISFNDYWLQNSNIIVWTEWFNLRNIANKEINLLSKPQADWQILNSVFFRWRTINMQWILFSDTCWNLNSLIDEFKLRLSPINKFLKWKVWSDTRKIKATVENLTFWERDDNFITYELTFKSQESFWYKENEQSFAFANMTQSPRTEQIQNDWQTAFPLFVLWFNTADWTDNLSVKVWWIWITINQAITDWDILIIDWREKQVLLNWTEIDFDWIFLQLENWNNTLVFSINWTISIDVNIIFKHNLL